MFNEMHVVYRLAWTDNGIERYVDMFDLNEALKSRRILEMNGYVSTITTGVFTEAPYEFLDGETWL